MSSARISETDDAASPCWLVVLPPGTPGPAVERISAEATKRGWRSAASRGEEQVVLALEGPRAAGELGTLVAGLDADVLPILPVESYRRQRWRRRWLSALVSGLGLLIAAGIVLPLFAFLRPPPEPIVTPDLVRVAAVDEIVTGSAVLAHFHAQPILVIRVAPQGWQAVTAMCTTQSDCLLEWDVPRQLVVCPCHGCEFDAQGNVLHPPASTPLLRLEAFESGGTLFVRSLT